MAKAWAQVVAQAFGAHISSLGPFLVSNGLLNSSGKESWGYLLLRGPLPIHILMELSATLPPGLGF